MVSNRRHRFHQRRGMSTAQTIGTVLIGVLVSFVAFFGFVMWTQSARQTARQYHCMNNLKEIGLAMHNHHDSNGFFPPTYTTILESDRLQSWRTITSQFAISTGGSLDLQVRFDEPWDSQHNMAATQLMPDIFHCPTRAEKSSETTYFVVDTPQGLFDGAKPISFDDITDGSFRTIAALENSEMLERWNEPIDVTLKTATPLHSEHPNGVNVLIADGSIHRFAESLSPEVFQSLVLIDDGGPADMDKYTLRR